MCVVGNMLWLEGMESEDAKSGSRGFVNEPRMVFSLPMH